MRITTRWSAPCAGLAVAASLVAPAVPSAGWTQRSFGPRAAAGLAVGDHGATWVLVRNASRKPDDPGVPLAIQPGSAPFSAVPDPDARRQPHQQAGVNDDRH